jgi:DNA polymerase III subunit epsilon
MDVKGDVKPFVPGSPNVSLGPRESILTDRAIALLSVGPADSATVVREVCQIAAVPSGLADHLAAALLAADSRFARTAAGVWVLAPTEVVVDTDRSIDGLGYVVVDVETTGTRAMDGDRVMEVAVVEVRGGKVRVVFDSLINPERPIPGLISSLTNITPEMVRNAPVFADIASRLAAVLDGNVFVAHNAAFDWRFLSLEMQRATGRPLAGTRLCTVRMARRLVPGLRRRSLDAVTAFYGITITARHRAGGDAVATAEVLTRLLAAARDAGITTFDDLRSYLRAPRRPRRRPPAMPHSVAIDTTA